MINHEKYYLAIDSINKLPLEVKSQKVFIDLLKQANGSIQSFRIDSLMNLGNNSFGKGDYDQALKYYNKVIVDYDRDNNLAHAKVTLINKTRDSIRISKTVLAASQIPLRNETKKVEEKTSPPVNNNRNEIQYSFIISNPSGCEGIRLVNIISDNKNTVISLQFSPGNKSYKIFGPNNEDAYYIECISKNEKLQLPLKDMVLDGGIAPGKIIKVVKSAIVKLIFKKLPDDVNSFDLIQGKERMDESIVYCHFKGINIKRKP